jgi:hypothetical protein
MLKDSGVLTVFDRLKGEAVSVLPYLSKFGLKRQLVKLVIKALYKTFSARRGNDASEYHFVQALMQNLGLSIGELAVVQTVEEFIAKIVPVLGIDQLMAAFNHLDEDGQMVACEDKDLEMEDVLAPESVCVVSLFNKENMFSLSDTHVLENSVLAKETVAGYFEAELGARMDKDRFTDESCQTWFVELADELRFSEDVDVVDLNYTSVLQFIDSLVENMSIEQLVKHYNSINGSSINSTMVLATSVLLEMHTPVDSTEAVHVDKTVVDKGVNGLSESEDTGSSEVLNAEDSEIIAMAASPDVQTQAEEVKTPCYLLNDLKLLPKPFAICTQDMAETYQKHLEALIVTGTESVREQCEADLAKLRDLVWCDETGFYAGAGALAKGKYRTIKASFFKKFALVA